MIIMVADDEKIQNDDEWWRLHERNVDDVWFWLQVSTLQYNCGAVTLGIIAESSSESAETLSFDGTPDIGSEICSAAAVETRR